MSYHSIEPTSPVCELADPLVTKSSEYLLCAVFTYPHPPRVLLFLETPYPLV